MARVTLPEKACSDRWATLPARPNQPLGYLADGNCSQVLCVEVTERYSWAQLLVGNLPKYPTNGGILDEEEM